MKNLIIISISTLFLTSCVSEKASVKKGSQPSSTIKQYYACINNAGESTSDLYTFNSDGTLSIEMINYDSNNCTEVSAREKNMFYGEYSYNDASGSYSETLNRLEIAYLTSAEVALQNTAVNCNFNDWAVDVLKDATDNDDCIGGTVYSNNTPSIYNGSTLNDSIFYNGSQTYNRVQ